eukprot:408002_1
MSTLALILMLIFMNSNSASYYIQPWMCLQRCGFNTTDINLHLEQIQNYSQQGLINSISFEKYNLGPNGTLILDNDLDNVTPQLQTINNIELWPMISSYPYPPEFLTWMRQLFNNETLCDQFIDQCKQQAKTYNYNGFNVDWEPQTGPQPTEQDAINYALFLNKFAQEMHSINKQLSVDIGSWNLLWNLTLISQTEIDYIITMNTYTNHYKTWLNALNEDMQQINNWNDKLVVGLSTFNLSAKKPFSENQLQMRFDILQEYNIHKIGIWDMPLQSDWQHFLTEFVNNATTTY